MLRVTSCDAFEFVLAAKSELEKLLQRRCQRSKLPYEQLIQHQTNAFLNRKTENYSEKLGNERGNYLLLLVQKTVESIRWPAIPNRKCVLEI